MPRPSPVDRARMFAAKARPSIAGQHGHDALYAVACALVVGFALNDSDAFTVISDYNASSCNPSWSDKDLRRKIDQAKKVADREPHKVGELLATDRPDYTGPRLNQTPPGPPTSGAPPPKPTQPAQRTERTPRTPVFNIRRFGEGGQRRTSRTIRTLADDSLHKGYPINPHTKSNKEVSEESEPKEPSIKQPSPIPTTQNNNPKPSTLPRGATLTTTMRTGEVVREHSNGRREQRSPTDPIT